MKRMRRGWVVNYLHEFAVRQVVRGVGHETRHTSYTTHVGNEENYLGRAGEGHVVTFRNKSPTNNAPRRKYPACACLC